MLALVKAHTTFLAAARASISSTSTWDVTCANHAIQLQAALRITDVVDLQDAANALEHLCSSGCFAPAQQAEIVATINLLASGPIHASVAQRSQLKQQEHNYFHKYCSAGDWAVLRNPSTSMSIKIETVINRCVAIGLLSMTEKTSQAITCTLVASSDVQVDHIESHNIMTELKNAFRKMRLTRSVAQKQSLSKFPEDISQFMSQCPGMYLVDDQPVKCPIDEKLIMSLRGTIACRKTHLSLRTNTQLVSGSSSSGSPMHFMHAMMPFMQAMQGMAMQPKRPRCDSPLRLTHLKTPLPPRGLYTAKAQGVRRRTWRGVGRRRG
jgi:hypothetical protein